MGTKIVSIEDCAEVLPGFSLKTRAKHDSQGSHQVILPSHLVDGEPYRYQEEHQLRMTPDRSVDNYTVQPGDVLFISRGTRNLAASVEVVLGKTIASGMLYLLRPKKGVDPSYLAWVINQSPIQASIGQARTGAGTPLVQRSLFQEIQIPLPPLEKQKQIAKVGELMAKERSLRQSLTNETNTLHRLIGARLINNLG